MILNNAADGTQRWRIGQDVIVTSGDLKYIHPKYKRFEVRFDTKRMEFNMLLRNFMATDIGTYVCDMQALGGIFEQHFILKGGYEIFSSLKFVNHICISCINISIYLKKICSWRENCKHIQKENNTTSYTEIALTDIFLIQRLNKFFDCIWSISPLINLHNNNLSDRIMHEEFGCDQQRKPCLRYILQISCWLNAKIRIQYIT